MKEIYGSDTEGGRIEREVRLPSPFLVTGKQWSFEGQGILWQDVVPQDSESAPVQPVRMGFAVMGQK